MRTGPKPRPRVNQPLGYLAASLLKPRTYYGRRHDYVYYPEAWVDESTGTSYEMGYYDENGERYDNVAFETNGRYDNVLCHCAYCGQDSVLNLSAEEAAQSLQCPHCGAPMEIRSALDEILDQPAENTHVYDSEESLRPFTEKSGKRKKKKRWGWWVLAILVLLAGYGKHLEDTETLAPAPAQQYSAIQNGTASGQRLYLDRIGRGVYSVSDSVGDKTLVWDADYESYYDKASDCWLWYNTDVEPAVWQYWYEGISSDYGDYGWMEHEKSGWYIEASEGEWIALPSRYPTDALWYIQD